MQSYPKSSVSFVSNIPNPQTAFQYSGQHAATTTWTPNQPALHGARDQYADHLHHGKQSYLGQELTHHFQNVEITHSEISHDEAASLFCVSCSCPMQLKIRLEPCYHLSCYECLPNLTNHPSCPFCQAPIENIMAIHSKNKLFMCSKNTMQDMNACPGGRAFLNQRSLACHELFFHEFKDNITQNEQTCKLDDRVFDEANQQYSGTLPTTETSLQVNIVPPILSPCTMPNANSFSGEVALDDNPRVIDEQHNSTVIPQQAYFAPPPVYHQRSNNMHPQFTNVPHIDMALNSDQIYSEQSRIPYQNSQNHTKGYVAYGQSNDISTLGKTARQVPEVEHEKNYQYSTPEDQSYYDEVKNASSYEKDNFAAQRQFNFPAHTNMCPPDSYYGKQPTSMPANQTRKQQHPQVPVQGLLSEVLAQNDSDLNVDELF